MALISLAAKNRPGLESEAYQIMLVIKWECVPCMATVSKSHIFRCKRYYSMFYAFAFLLAHSCKSEPVEGIRVGVVVLDEYVSGCYKS